MNDMKSRIREMRKNELKRVLRFIRLHDNQDARYASRYYREYFKRWGKGWDKVIIAEAGGKLAGVSGYFYDNEEARGIYWLGYTYIHPKYRGRGVGSQLLDYVFKDLKRRQARKLFLSTSSHAIYGGAVSFYTEHGFRWEGTLKDLYGPGEDQIVMGKDLTRGSRRSTAR
jgi:ribosomal protein S18 acetylase RimI-like enzyme